MNARSHASTVLRRSILAGFYRRVDRLYFDDAQGVWHDAKPYGNCTFANSSLLPVLKELGTPGRLVGCPADAMAGTGLAKAGLAAGHDWVVTDFAIYDIWAMFYLRTPPVLELEPCHIKFEKAAHLYPHPRLWKPVPLDPEWLEESSQDWAAFFNEEVWPATDRRAPNDKRDSGQSGATKPAAQETPSWMRDLSSARKEKG